MFKSAEKFGNYQGNQFAYRETPKFKNAVHELEQFDELGNQNRIVILATALDLKPASLIGIKITDNEVRHRLERILSDLGVFFQENPAPHDSSVSHIVIGGTPETIATAIENTRAGATDEQFGSAMGFPDTAIDSYSNDNVFDDSLSKDLVLSQDEMRKKLTAEERKFSFFRFSKGHYEKEVEWIEQIAAATKEYAPILYEKIMSRSDGW
ncbi:hypothetical protein BH11PAT2_BH11PAT2_07770 [soil metagenome]